MQKFLLLLIGFRLCSICIGQGTTNLKYRDKATLDSLNHSQETIKACKFDRVTIKGEASFYNSKFLEETFFHSVNFSNTADFTFAKFSKEANFTVVRFSKGASFSSAEFSEGVDFTFAKFSKGANFTLAKFSRGANFTGVNFLEEVAFTGVTFLERVNFFKARFSKIAGFSGTTFYKQPSFYGSQLPDTLYFSEVDLQNIKDDVLLNEARLDSLRKNTQDSTKKCTIFLIHTDVSKLVLDHEKYRIGFYKETGLEEKVSTIQQVIKKCKDIGMEASAQGFDTDLQKMKLEDRWGWASSTFIGFQHYWWNFGYDRSRIIQNTLYAFLVSFIMFFIGYKRFFAAYFPSDQLGMKADNVFMPAFNRSWAPSAANSKASKFMDRIKITFFYTALVFFGWKMDHSKLNYRTYPWTALLVYLIYIIGLIHLAYLAGFVIAR